MLLGPFLKLPWYEPLVSKELWEKAQQVNQERASNNTSKMFINPVFPLRGLVYCTQCGMKLTASAPMGRSKRYEYYHHGSRGCEVGRNIPKKELEEKFLDTLRELVPEPEQAETAKQIVLTEWKRRLDIHIQSQNDFHQRLTQLKQEKSNLLADKRRNPELYTDEEFKSQKQELNNQITELESQVSVDKTIERNFDKVCDLVFTYLADPASAWKYFGIKKKQQLQHAFFPNGITFDGQAFGTTEICLCMQLIKAINQESNRGLDNISKDGRGN
jgi:site-specific DNA recombinase